MLSSQQYRDHHTIVCIVKFKQMYNPELVFIVKLDYAFLGPVILCSKVTMVWLYYCSEYVQG